ncbi:hypothetical protein [Paenibacillus solani]|uniref:hypothetical protein n=1 Tax=Paenibacillus solani TaxID=1705565 RepID=UPI003D2E5E98
MYYLYSAGLLFGGLSIINLVFSYQAKHIQHLFWPTLQFQLVMLPLFLIANMCIGYGIRYGFKATDQLGFTLIFSKCLEILISLGVAYVFLKEVPTWKNWAGIGIIALGIFLVKQK